MADYLQTDRPLTISTPLGPDALLVAAFRGREAVSELFAFEFHLLAPLANPPVDLDELLGQTVTADVNPITDLLGPPRKVCGAVTAVRQGHRDREFTHLHATVRPPWWYATLRTNSRAFQQVTVVDILKDVLGPFGAIETRLATEYPVRDYTCQYQEADFAFASRLMEEEGIFYSFRHEDGKLTLVLADTLANAPAAAVPLGLRYDPASGPAAPGRECRAWAWEKTRAVCPTAVTTWDATFELFRQNLAADATAPATATAGEVTHKLAPKAVGPVPVYLHDGDSAKRFDGVEPGGGDQSKKLQGVYDDARRTARVRAEALAAAAVRVAGEGNCPHLVPGTTVGLTGHYDADGTYLVTAVEHEAEFHGTYGPGDAGTASYRNTFAAAPPDLAPRPPRATPRPRVGGPLTAVVVGPSGQEIFVDKYGRVKVQFLWDRQGKFDANSSCWVRCSQLWAGKQWGAFFWPRIGMEVVVHFEDGDPDRPLITGCVYNGTNKPPPDLPGEAMIAGIKTCIFHGDPASQYNSIYFFDAPDYEYILIHSETHTVSNAEVHKSEYVPGISFEFRGTI
ncbi:type VI secretion system Vgr family protein [Gemmata sp.]|uniref:type VI secretion system Vgr family protein n=1 Tax=Gemmata sp. TaxID=1914242 RepID=UPI003F6FAF9F